MIQRSYIFLAIGIGAIFLALFLNLIPSTTSDSDQEHLLPGEVKGMEIVYHEKPYTLSFEQQNRVVHMINRAIPVGAEDLMRGGTPPPFSEVRIFRFKVEDIILKPLLFKKDGNLIFTLSNRPSHDFLQDVSLGEMQKLFETLYDH